ELRRFPAKTGRSFLPSPPAASMSLPHLGSRIFNVPLLIEPRKLEAILAVLGPRLGLRAEMIPALRDDSVAWERAGASSLVAVISVIGTLVKRSGGLNAQSGLTSNE